MDITLDDVLRVLEDVKEGVDYASETKLVDNRVLDSFDILSLISALDEEFDVSIPAKDIVPDNFNSAEALLKMLQRLQDED